MTCLTSYDLVPLVPSYQLQTILLGGSRSTELNLY
jgi:hypothetical protein